MGFANFDVFLKQKSVLLKEISNLHVLMAMSNSKARRVDKYALQKNITFNAAWTHVPFPAPRGTDTEETREYSHIWLITFQYAFTQSSLIRGRHVRPCVRSAIDILKTNCLEPLGFALGCFFALSKVNVYLLCAVPLKLTGQNKKNYKELW